MNKRRLQAGFGLIEIMIGVVISIIASVVMFQTFSVSERQKRTTTGAADAQSNGAVAIFMMERDIKMAGWGLQLDDFISGCNTIYSYYSGGGTPGPIDGLFATVKVTDGGTLPDSVRIQYYDDPKGQANNYRLGTTGLSEKMQPDASVVLNVKNPHVCNIDTDGDGKYPLEDHDNDDKPLALIRDKTTGNCTLMQITSILATSLKLNVNTGEGDYNAPWTVQKDVWPSYGTDSEIQCFRGVMEYRRTYRINNQHLQLDEPDSAGVTQSFQMAPGIVDLQAQYGITNVGGSKVTSWVDATGDWVTPSTANTKRIIAVRLALLARSANYEKPDDGSTNCTTTTTAMAAAWSPWATFNTSGYADDWKCYRYKVFELEVPLRNIIWAKPWE